MFKPISYFIIQLSELNRINFCKRSMGIIYYMMNYRYIMTEPQLSTISNAQTLPFSYNHIKFSKSEEHKKKRKEAINIKSKKVSYGYSRKEIPEK